MAGLWFGVLGPLVVRTRAEPVTIQGPRQRNILAALLLNPNQSVGMTELVAAAWENEEPPGSRRQVQNSVSQIRTCLAHHGYDGLWRDAVGYGLRVGPDEQDLLQFKALVAAADLSEQAGDLDRAIVNLRVALSLWRGPAVVDVTAGRIRADAARLDEQRLAAAATYARHLLAREAPDDVVAELSDLVAANPLHERLAARYMHALYQVGRQADALNVYRCSVAVLADELGLDPGPELSEMYRQVLHHDPALMPARHGSTGAASGTATPSGVLGDQPADANDPAPADGSDPHAVSVVPAQLPAEVADFTGRHAELKQLDDVLASRLPGLPISVVCGPAGVGKTALAVRWAHLRADLFPDGHLYVNLRGADPLQPMAPDEALDGFLAALGVPPAEGALGLEAKAARYRTELARRRVLVVLDNAATADQVRPLLPGSGTGAVLVTSREDLAGLVAVQGAHRLALDLLPAAEAEELLCHLIGPPAIADPDAVTALASRCGRLPLALRIAAELAVSRPSAALPGLVAELSHWRDRLDVLDVGGDPRSAVRTVLSWSLRHLTESSARMFRLLGLHPGTSIGPAAAAALADADPGTTRRTLDGLTRAHLVHRTGGHYGQHDLLRAYAAELAGAVDTAAARHAAHQRLFDHYLGTAGAAMDVLHPANRIYRPAVPAPTPAADFAGPGDAHRWLDAELPNLVAMAAYTAEHGWPAHTIGLSGVLARYLVNGARIAEAITIHSHAARAAEQTGDLTGRAAALLSLAGTNRLLCRHRLAADQADVALELFRRCGDRTGEARALMNIGLITAANGRYRSAVTHLRASVALFRRIGDRNGEGNTEFNLCAIELMRGRPTEAAAHGRAALRLYREIGDPVGEPHALVNLGAAEVGLGRPAVAGEYLQRALEVFRRRGDRYGIANATLYLGTLQVVLGRPASAVEILTEAVTIFSAHGDRRGQVTALNDLGEATLAAEQSVDAVAHHLSALSLLTGFDAPAEQARAHAGLGRSYRSCGNLELAGRHDEQARAWYARLER